MTALEIFNRSISGKWKTAGTDTQYRVEIIDGVQYVFFQPTMSRDDWIKNFMAWPRESIHSGYLLRYDEARQQVLQELKKMPTLFAGYSMGAAIALLFHVFEAGILQAPCRSVLFACPRVFWNCYNEGFLADEIDSYYVGGDPVSHLPFAFLGYVHFGRRMRLGPKRFPRPRWHQAPEYRLALLDVCKEY